MKTIRALLLVTASFIALPLAAHHSYALFDLTKPVTLSGSAAKLEWRNPHVFVWVYVPDKKQKSGYQLYAFEAGSLVVMGRQGWDRNSVKAGDAVTVDYLPLLSGEPGGALLKLKHADGRTLDGDPFGRQLMNQITTGKGQ